MYIQCVVPVFHFEQGMVGDVPRNGHVRQKVFDHFVPLLHIVTVFPRKDAFNEHVDWH
jgi:hypothetical protein